MHCVGTSTIRNLEKSIITNIADIGHITYNFEHQNQYQYSKIFTSYFMVISMHPQR